MTHILAALMYWCGTWCMIASYDERGKPAMHWFMLASFLVFIFGGVVDWIKL